MSLCKHQEDTDMVCLSSVYNFSSQETKTKLSQANAKIEEMKEEGEQIRNACQEMIKKYQV